MSFYKWCGLAIATLLVVGLLPTWALAAPAYQEEVSPNLLVDGDFEAPAPWPMQNGIGEVQVAPGWVAWYLDEPPSYIVPPPSCYNADGSRRDNGCFWMRPEYRDNIRQSYDYRVHSGDRSQKYFSFGRMHEAGIYQQVSNIPVGAKLRFSIYIQAWMCSNAKTSTKCADGRVSDYPSDMHLRIGIDPTGGTDPFSGNIVWSPEVPAWDTWVRFQVEAIAQSSTVTVFTHSRPQWDDWARMNNDIYLDDAELVIVGPVPTTAPTAAAPNQPQAQPQPQPQPQPQAVTRADGALVHRVVSGDTLLGIALTYGVTVDDIVLWNNLNPGDYLQIGQELVVKAPAGWSPPPANPAPAAAAQPVTTPVVASVVQPTPTPAPQPLAVAAAAPAGLCVTAFDDQNMNSLYDNNEGLVAGTRFNVLEGNAVVKTHTTDGSEPFCFTDLKPGTYLISIEPASGYKGTSSPRQGASVAAGQTVNVVFGSVAMAGSPPKSGDKAAPANPTVQTHSSSIWTQTGGILVGVVGIIVLAGAGVLGTVVLRRR